MPAPLGDLAAYEADVLDWPAVRELFAPYAPSPLALRALRELTPRADDEARLALRRLAECIVALAAGEGPPLRGHPDPMPALTAARQAKRALGGEDLHGLARFLRAVEETAVWLAAREGALPNAADTLAGRPDTRALGLELERSVDEKGAVQDGASPLLARLRKDLAELREEVERRARGVANRPELRTALADGQAGQVHRRGGRPVLAVKAKSRGRVPGLVHDASQSGETLFVEPEEVVEAGNRLAEVRADEAREVARVLVELTQRVLARADDVLWLCARLEQLELALCGAAWARANGGRPARIPGQPGAAAGLCLRGFRHPLLLAAVRAGRLERVEPLDLRLGDDFDLLVLTGPNTGGKTLALKSAGLCVLLTRLGLPLACEEGTTVPLWTGIAADIGDEQEIQQSLSTFSSHLRRIRAALERAGPRTLVLLDELGGGTDPAEGAALGAAILAELCERGAKTLVTTHLGQLKEFAYRHARAANGSVEFDLSSLAPLYRVVIGLPGESRALAIARRLGFPEALVRRAERRLEQRPDETQALLADLRGVRVDAERLRSSAGDRLAELEARLAALQVERDLLEQRGQQLEAEAQRGVEERVGRARPALVRARALLAQLPKAQAQALAEALDELALALGGATLSERRRGFLDALKKGDFVWLPKYKKRCQVVRVKAEKREVVVRLLRQELAVSFDDVTFYESL